MNKNVIVFFYLFLQVIFASNITAQVSQIFVAFYNGPLDSVDVARDIIVDNAGNIYVAGYSGGLLTGTDYAIVKYNSSGNQIWVRRYSGPAPLALSLDEAFAIALDNSGNLYVTGFSTGLFTGSDYATIKFDSSGNQIWVARYNGPANSEDRAYAIDIDNSNNVIVTGSSRSGIFGNDDYLTIKYDSIGSIIWVIRDDLGFVDRPYAIGIDNSNNVVITGSRKLGILGTEDCATVKYNSMGVQQWASIYDGTGNEDIAYALGITSNNDPVITGSTRNTSSQGSEDYVTVRYNSSNGNQQWVRTYNGTGNNEDRAYAIDIDNSDNVVVTGFTRTLPSNTDDYGTVKYDQNGNQQWDRTYNGTGNGEDRAYAIDIDGSSNVYVTGSSTGSGTNSDYATVKYNPGGSQQWAVRYDTAGGEDRAYAIDLDNSNNVYVTGSGTRILYSDYATIKYSQESSLVIKPISSLIPEEFKLSQNYPNPFNPITKIRFDLPQSVFLSGAKNLILLKIYDILGREVVTLINEVLKPGSYEVEWDGKDLKNQTLTSGIYFYKLQANGFSDTKKMILLK
ncbi:MAG: SBBP repeat-containing protein [Ignavibacteria bacterium]